nr:serine hydrolase [Achromobacter sp. Marseille-Q0513]
MGGRDVTDVSATMDLYGGGGLVMSARDLARWTADLFEGRVYERPATLAEMLAPGAHEGADGYRLGLFAKRIGGAEVYFHLGYWGTAAYYCPALRLAMAGFTAKRETRTGMLAVMEGALENALLNPDPFLNTPAPLA